jgi:hypothetical protein
MFWVNGSAAIPMMDEAMMIWPVEETGKNSVKPSTIARMMASMIDIYG